ncbi:deoxyribonuclease-2-alpha-like [Thunnus albacares]|uniref:deoxyribonuclease-2-alpha-like n=1 Tax=Thunnus albacares TaxID=8236 RepID=UPI001CF7024D|nr:deoxyribonuclease-2-alpha-like [Thunnus albacares]
MWRLVLTVSLLCCSSEGQVTCRDENNGEVDWYILYKTPKNPQLTGLDYIYIYPDAQGRAKSQRNDQNKNIASPNGVLANTLQPLFKLNQNNPLKNFGYISYSDQPPEYIRKSVSPSYGHSKGKQRKLLSHREHVFLFSADLPSIIKLTSDLSSWSMTLCLDQLGFSSVSLV